MEYKNIYSWDGKQVPKAHNVKYPQKASGSHQTVLFQLFINGLPSMCLIIVVNNSHTTLFQIKSSWSNQGLEDGILQVLKNGVST